MTNQISLINNDDENGKLMLNLLSGASFFSPKEKTQAFTYDHMRPIKKYFLKFLFPYSFRSRILSQSYSGANHPLFEFEKIFRFLKIMRG